jgi:putative hydrolase of the HAD superfamily
MIKVIGFDLDDTLWAVKPIILRAEKLLDHWLKENAPPLQYDSIAMRSLRGQVLKQTPKLVHQITELRRRIIHEAMLRSDISGPEAKRLSDAAIEIFLAARNEVSFFDGALEAIGQLANSYVLGALTNGNADISRLGLTPYFSFSFSAEQVGAPKPAPNLFSRALAHTNTEPHEMIYIGDDPVLDIDTANNVGMHTIWVNSKKVKSQGYTAPDVIVSSVKELPEAVSHIASQHAPQDNL